MDYGPWFVDCEASSVAFIKRPPIHWMIQFELDKLALLISTMPIPEVYL